MSYLKPMPERMDELEELCGVIVKAIHLDQMLSEPVVSRDDEEHVIYLDNTALCIYVNEDGTYEPMTSTFYPGTRDVPPDVSVDPLGEPTRSPYDALKRLVLAIIADRVENEFEAYGMEKAFREEAEDA